MTQDQSPDGPEGPDVTDSPDRPPSRDGLTDAEVWEWREDHWQVRRIGAHEEPNLGGSPAPVNEP